MCLEYVFIKKTDKRRPAKYKKTHALTYRTIETHGMKKVNEYW